MAIDETKGKLKEAAGSLTGSDDLRNEGQAQQKKGEHEDEAARLRAEAQAAEGKADNAEDREKKHQGS
ncbi:MAG TPA: hypothetical protein VLR26_00680 [Frankiaceae bacterium]|nr:hypothetical protein [Frankiaceae bacterium]